MSYDDVHLDTENNITAFAGPDQPEAIIAAGAQPSASSEDLTQLATDWPVERWVAIWNQPAGRGAGEAFKNPKAAARKISLSTPGGPHEFLLPALNQKFGDHSGVQGRIQSAENRDGLYPASAA